jgi:hypothetical protein
VLSVAEATHVCLPFHHFLLYGVGKPLVERGLLPESLRRRVDRMSDAAPAAGAGGAAGLLLKLLEAHDARNDRAETAAARTFVNVVLLARRPGSARVYDERLAANSASAARPLEERRLLECGTEARS